MSGTGQAGASSDQLPVPHDRSAPGQLRAARSRSTSVHSIERVFALLGVMADEGGATTLSNLAMRTGLPAPSIHRLIRTLVTLGYVRQAQREYVLAPRFIRLGDAAAQMLNVWAHPHLSTLVTETGESANLAMIDGDFVVFVAHVPSHHSLRVFSEIGERATMHSTAVGKALLAGMSRAQVDGILARTGMPAHTPNTISDPALLHQALEEVSAQGYALNDGEQEFGCRCVAVRVPDVLAGLAISISGPAARMSDERIAAAVPLLQKAAAALSDDLR